MKLKCNSVTADGHWDMEHAQTLAIGTATHPVTRMLAVMGRLWCASKNEILVLNISTLKVVVSISRLFINIIALIISSYRHKYGGNRWNPSLGRSMPCLSRCRNSPYKNKAVVCLIFLMGITILIKRTSLYWDESPQISTVAAEGTAMQRVKVSAVIV